MGLKDSIKNLFKKEEKPISQFDTHLFAIFKDIDETHNTPNFFYAIPLSKLETFKEITKKEADFKRKFVFYLIEKGMAYSKIKNSNKASNRYGFHRDVCFAVLSSLLRTNLEFSAKEIIAILMSYKEHDNCYSIRFVNFPVAFTIQQLERIIKKEGFTEEIEIFLKNFITWPQLSQKTNYSGSDLGKVKVKVQTIISKHSNTTPVFQLNKDQFGDFVNPKLKELDSDLQNNIYQLCYLFTKASASKPSAKFLKESNALIDEIGILKYKNSIHPWLEFLGTMKPIEHRKQHQYDSGHVYNYTEYDFLDDKNSVFVKGLVWSLSKFHDSKTLSIIAKLAERSFQKIPGVGPTAAAVGNACLYVLGNTKGLEGISHLSRLKLKVKQNNTKNLIHKYLDTASQKLGITASEIEEISIPDFGLINGKKTVLFKDYELHISIQELGKVALIWKKPDGKEQKSVPSFVKSNETLSKKLKKVKADVTQIKKYLTAQRDRIDSIYLDNREWKLENFNKYYFEHGLISFIAQKLVWQFKKEDTYVTALYDNNQWIDSNGDTITWLTEETIVRLWHPIYGSTKETLYWRNTLENLHIKQPLKQVYREVYILTDAEITTKSYSNRMAAHILKQHQLNALASIRGWKYTLMGAFDNGINADMASKEIKAYEMTAEFWINEIATEDQFNDTGIWNYVATDQVKFVTSANDAIDLIDIPPLVLSEVMRDVDLFVGVCSVGNDPEWQDNGGLPQYRDYWTSYSFGDLNEVAKTRKQILEKLLPRLKIKHVASIDGKFLKIKGTKRTYKIHIGSSNILMEPNDQYLCIVADRGKKTTPDNVFLPFEGDKGLSLVLSKALLLAADDKITDSTILSQINRG